MLKFGEGREHMFMYEIKPKDLEDWIAAQKTWSLSSRKTVMSMFSNLWDMAKDKGWCSINIVDRLEPITRPGREVKIYPNIIVKNLLAASQENDITKTATAELAIGFFGCMRPEETHSVKALRNGHPPFDWSKIDLEHGVSEVTREVAKTGDERNPRLHTTAVKWLKLAKEMNNPLPPVNDTKNVDLCCELIGLDDWLRDGMRKCCATHLRDYYGDDYDVVETWATPCAFYSDTTRTCTCPRSSRKSIGDSLPK